PDQAIEVLTAGVADRRRRAIPGIPTGALQFMACALPRPVWNRLTELPERTGARTQACSAEVEAGSAGRHKARAASTVPARPARLSRGRTETGCCGGERGHEPRPYALWDNFVTSNANSRCLRHGNIEGLQDQIVGVAVAVQVLALVGLEREEGDRAR